MLIALEVLGLTLALAHFTVPLAYYAYARLKWLKRPWDLSIDENYKPKVTVIIPTYNESKLIEKKLDNIYEQDYPKELMEIVAVDSASTERTWHTTHLNKYQKTNTSTYHVTQHYDLSRSAYVYENKSWGVDESELRYLG